MEVLPAVAPTEGDFAWLSFPGHWGERRPMFNDGPTGPAMKDQWNAPVAWVEEEGRADAVAVPFGGSPATDAFCNVSQELSQALLHFLDHPVRFGLVAVLVIAALVFVVRRSSQGLLAASVGTYRRNASQLLQIGAALVVAGAASLLVHNLMVRLTPVGDVFDVLGDDSPWALPVIVATAALVSFPIMAWVMAASVEVVVVDAGRRPPSGATVVAAERRAGDVPHRAGPGHRPRRDVGARRAAARRRADRRTLVRRAGRLRRRRRLGHGRAASRHAALLHGHRLRSIGLMITLVLILAVPGVVGALLLIVTGISFAVASVVVVVGAVVLVPFVAVVITRFYLTLLDPTPPSRSDDDPVRETRSIAAQNPEVTP